MEITSEQKPEKQNPEDPETSEKKGLTMKPNTEEKGKPKQSVKRKYDVRKTEESEIMKNFKRLTQSLDQKDIRKGAKKMRDSVSQEELEKNEIYSEFNQHLKELTICSSKGYQNLLAMNVVLGNKLENENKQSSEVKQICIKNSEEIKKIPEVITKELQVNINKSARRTEKVLERGATDILKAIKETNTKRTDEELENVVEIVIRKVQSTKQEKIKKTKEDDEILECEKCKKKYRSVKSLKKHDATAHNIVSTFKAFHMNCEEIGCYFKSRIPMVMEAHKRKHIAKGGGKDYRHKSGFAYWCFQEGCMYDTVVDEAIHAHTLNHILHSDEEQKKKLESALIEATTGQTNEDYECAIKKGVDLNKLNSDEWNSLVKIVQKV